ncbi:MAG: ribose-phosphate diphosphokinase [Saprospiraceae bacterium]|jgi:ribose-phosphate pyrophosphokinase|nr:ribose-phosphate diphosphokinase [Saprospiraceae bacterium]
MLYLNLDKKFQPFGKSIKFENFVFNGGEPHIKILENLEGEKQITITTRIQHFNDLGLLLIAVDALKRMGIQYLNLVLPYFPAARQDRVMVVGESLSVKVYADIINAQNFQKITVLDPHSEVTPALLNNVQVVSNHAFVSQCLQHEKDYILVSPDGGALKKVYALSQYLGGKTVVECSKKRNVQTGELSGFTVYEEDLKNQTCVIVDDICDGGGTFLGLATELKKKNCGRLILIISHGIFSKGLVDLMTSFDKIYSSNSFKEVDDNKIFTQIKLNKNTLL